MVRGIFTTALVKLLLDRGFKIAKPSTTTSRRFGLKEAPKDWNARIRDYKPLKGSIIIDGLMAPQVASAVMEALPDSILNRKKVGYEIYKGIVEEVNEKGSYVNYGNGIGFLPEKLVEGQEVVVSPIKNEVYRGNLATLTRKIRIVGHYADLVKEGWVSAPKGIPAPIFNKLMNLGHMLKPSGWGIQWKKEALRASMGELIEELQRLKEEAMNVLQKASESKAPYLIYDPPTCYVVMLPYDSKKSLDELRSLVAATMPYHHLIKSWGRKYAYTVDVIEELMPSLGAEVGIEAARVIMRGLVKEGAKMMIEHMKPDGKVYMLTPGVVEEFDEEEMTITLKREFKGGGVYDGLGVPKERGDYGLSTYRVGSPISKTKYYDERNNLKGVYVNISTSVELAPRKVRYVDLEVDVIAKPDGEVNIVDLDKAKRLVDEGLITNRLYNAIIEMAEKVKEALLKKGDVELTVKFS